MNGHIIPNSYIAVDFWKVKGRQDNLIHFLTHLHGDHIVGLTPTWSKRIYCSNITAELLKSKHGISSQHLHVLPLNESVHIDTPSFGSFTVTTFDANHCPGAVMFYFQGRFGNIFYTGDFRASESLIESCLSLKGKIDVLYLDNTYCSPKCIFPSQEECFDEIVEIIQQHPDHNVLIGVHNLGKEVMLQRLGAVLNETIAVSSEMYKICDCLFERHFFTIHSNESRIRTIALKDITLYCLQKFKPCIAIKPTALFFGMKDKQVMHPDIFVVPYSDHSSYEELHNFIRFLKPAQVLPIVKSHKGPFGLDISERTDMSCFKSLLSTGSPSLEISTFNKSHLLINDQDESISEFQSTAHSPFQEMGDFAFNARETSIQTRKRKKPPPHRIKKIPSGIVYDESSSEESTDQSTLFP